MMTISDLMLRPAMGSFNLFQKDVGRRQKAEVEAILTMKAMSYLPKLLVTVLRKEEGYDRRRETLSQSRLDNIIIVSAKCRHSSILAKQKNDLFFFCLSR